LFSIPFLFSDYFAWSIIFFPISLFFIRDRVSKFFLYGFVWGLVAYGLHFLWLFDLLVRKSSASVWFSLTLYVCIVLYASLTSSIWFFASRFISWFFASLIYFFLLNSYMFWFLGTGYPFVNPFIPLMRYKSVSTFYHMPKQKRAVLRDCAGKTYAFAYLSPCPAPIKEDIFACTSHIYRQLEKLRLGEWASEYDRVVVVGPETTFPFALNKNKDLIGFWGQLLPENCSIMLGSVRLGGEQRDRFYQTVYWLGRRLIINFYDKSQGVPFTEQLPHFWKRYGWARLLFLDGKLSVSKGTEGRLFVMSPACSIQPLICSELFLAGNLNGFVSKPPLIAFVNDSWFCGYFRKTMVFLSKLNACFYDRGVMYVGHVI